jgi:hypothetical protein
MGDEWWIWLISDLFTSCAAFSSRRPTSNVHVSKTKPGSQMLLVLFRDKRYKPLGVSCENA